LPLVFKHQPYRPLTHFRRIPLHFVHNSILSRIGVSGNPGAIHTLCAVLLSGFATHGLTSLAIIS
ncbi:MAG: hypothetical protein WCE58_00405, partial [Gallionella sp.]